MPNSKYPGAQMAAEKVFWLPSSLGPAQVTHCWLEGENPRSGGRRIGSTAPPLAPATLLDVLDVLAAEEELVASAKKVEGKKGLIWRGRRDFFTWKEGK